MDIVIDANVLFRILISQGDIIDIFTNSNLVLYAPERLQREFMNHASEIREKSSLSHKGYEELTQFLFRHIHAVALEEYQSFLPKAKKILGEHEKDIEFIALCLLKKCKLWTYEKRLFKLGFGISTREIIEQLHY